MKKTALTLLAAAFVFSLSFALAADYSALLPEAAAAEILESVTVGDNITATLYSDYTLVIDGEGEMTVPLDSADVRYIHKIVISSGITAICESAFSDFSYVEEVVFEENSRLEKIGIHAFSSCYSLNEIKIPASVTLIDEYAFAYCYNLNTIVFEENSRLRNIGDQAFVNIGITELSIPSSVEEISGGAFSSNKNLKSVTFGADSKLKSLGETTENLPYLYYNGVFAYCEKLEEIKIPASVTVIGNKAFYYCTKLNKVEIEAGSKLTRIDEYAFANCYAIAEINFPEGLVEIGKAAFSNNCLTKIAIPASVEEIGENAFEDCNYVSEISFASGSKLKSIGDSAFSGCNVLEKLQLPTGLKTIGENAFDGCYKLDSVILPDGIEFVGEAAFVGTAASEIRIPASVTYFGAGSYGKNLERYIVEDGNEVYASDSNGALFSKDMTTLYVYPTASPAKEYTIPQGVQTIADSAFLFNLNLESIKMPDTVKEIGDLSLAIMLSLKEIRLSSKLESVGEEAFLGCFYLEELVIPASVRYIGADAFSLLTSVKRIEIHSRTVDCDDTFLGFSAFLTDDVAENQFRIDVMADYYEFIMFYDIYAPENENRLYEISEKLDGFVNEENIRTDIYTVYCYEGAVVEAYLKENNVKYAYLCAHTEMEVIPAVTPGCSTDGLTAGIKCALCGEILTAQQIDPMIGHAPEVQGEKAPEIGVPGYTGDMVCTVCGETVEYGEEIPALEDNTQPECDHICHKDGVLGILWKIIGFFAKLFKTNPVCECGAAHY